MCFKRLLECFCFKKKSLFKEFKNLKDDSLDEKILIDSEVEPDFQFGKIVIYENEFNNLN